MEILSSIPGLQSGSQRGLTFKCSWYQTPGIFWEHPQLHRKWCDDISKSLVLVFLIVKTTFPINPAASCPLSLTLALPRGSIYSICCLDAKMLESAYLKTNEKLMGHHKKSVKTSCDITWKRMMVHAVNRLCFVSHYANAFFSVNADSFSTQST